MDVLMSQRRPFLGPSRHEPAQPQKINAPSRPVAVAMQPPEVVHLWMLPQSQPSVPKETPARAALAYKAAKMVVSAK